MTEGRKEGRKGTVKERVKVEKNDRINEIKKLLNDITRSEST
jgi:hypothetical protein